ncbi:tape measure protein [Lactobacillus delbrueckii subsp. lactis]|uniref:tape measure protein n=1 Tax=Lactobacillus delbrueckii TaxID=1584 RepID=UPI001E367212|nr:tape measure protein [Lactobacillus delbrueckii]MCD5515783.1 tape measure protein [Lactobacillus delbrueckii subsp. lactis]
MADGVVTIDLKFPANESGFKSDVAQVEEILKKIGSGTGNQAVANFNRKSNELKTTAAEAGGQVSKSVNEAGKQAGDKMHKNFASNVTAVEKAASSTAESVSATTTTMGKHAGSEMQKNFGSNSEDVKKSASGMGQDVDRTAKGMGKGAGDEMADSAQKNIGEVKKSFGSLGDYIKGSFIGSALEQATERVADFFKDMVTQATESFDALKSYTSTMKFAGFDTSEIKKGEEELKEYSKETIYNVGEMSNTAATLAANGVKNYVDVTKALGNLVAVAGGGAQDMQSASLALTQIVGAGKMYTGDWNQFINGIPGASGKIQKALKDAGAYTGNFRDAMSKGKISAQEMIAAIEKLGNTQIAKKAATDTSKFSVAWQGAQEAVQDGVLKLMDSLGTSGFTGAISAAGDSAYNALASIGQWISKHKDQLATLGEKLGYIKDYLEEIGSDIGQGFIQFFKDGYKWISKFTDSAGDGNDALDDLGLALDKVAENKGALQAIGKGLAAITTAMLGLKAIKGVAGLVTTLVKPFASLISLFMSFSGGPIILAIVAIGAAFVLAYKNIKPFRDFVNTIVKKAGSAFNSVAKAVSKAFKQISKAMAPIVKEFEKAWGQLLKFLKALWKDISAVVVGALKILFVVMSPLLLVIVGLVRLTMTTIKALVKGAMGFIKTLWQVTWKSIGTILKTAWNVIRDFLKYELKIITDILKLGTDILKGNWKNVWKDIKNIFSDVWNGMKSIVRDIWKGIKEYVADGVNGVIDLINGMITAINKVWTFFGGKGGINKLGHVHFATGGQLGSDGSVMAIVNDDGSPDPRELIQRKDGTLQMYQDRDAWTIINPGDKVYNSKQTKEIFNSIGVHYASGNVGGSIWDGVKSFFGGVADKLKDAIEWLKHPLRNTAKLIKGATDSFISVLPDSFKNLAGSMIGKMTSLISSKLEKLIQGYKDGNDDSNPGGAGVMRWKSYVVKALEANGIEPTGYRVSKILATIQRESGGNPRAINLWDSNAKAGIPSKGLMQTIGPTFNAYKLAGHGNIYNGYDNLLAAINYIKHRYGTSDAAFARVAASGYAKGGVIDREQMALIGEGNHTEFVVPNPSVAGPARTYEMIGRAAAYASQAGGGSGSIMSDNALKLVERKLDSLIDYNATQLAELKKPMRSYVLQSDIYKGYNEQQKINDMLGFFVR